MEQVWSRRIAALATVSSKLSGMLANTATSRHDYSLGIGDVVTSVGKSQPRSVGTVLIGSLLHCQEVTGRLRHLLSVEHQVTVDPDSLGPLLLREESSVTVNPEGQVVGDKILTGRSDVERIKVVEMVLELSGLLGVDRAVGRELTVSEDILPDLVGHLLRGNAKRAGVLAEHVLVKEVGDSVVGHVDGGVRERLDKPDRVPREFRTETVGSSARPLVEPVEDTHKGVSGLVLVGVELIEKPSSYVSTVFAGGRYDEELT